MRRLSWFEVIVDGQSTDIYTEFDFANAIFNPPPFLRSSRCLVVIFGRCMVSCLIEGSFDVDILAMYRIIEVDNEEQKKVEILLGKICGCYDGI